jgi:hypothetical protein
MLEVVQTKLNLGNNEMEALCFFGGTDSRVEEQELGAIPHEGKEVQNTCTSSDFEFSLEVFLRASRESGCTTIYIRVKGGVE